MIRALLRTSGSPLAGPPGRRRSLLGGLLVGPPPLSAPARRLALLRMVIGVWTTWYLARRRRLLADVARTDHRLFRPVGPARVLRRPLPAPVADTLTAATVASSALVTAGVAHRITGPVHAGLLLWTMAYRNSWSMVYHHENLFTVHGMLLGLSASADRGSVDAAWRVWRDQPGAASSWWVRPDHPADVSSWRYGWPILVADAVTVVPYVLSAVAKVEGPLGWSWASGRSLRRQVAVDAARKSLYGEPVPAAARLVAGDERLVGVLAAGTLALELAAPAMLVDRRLGRLWAVAAIGMHWGIRVLMGIRFRYQQHGVAFAPLVELDRVVDGVARAVRRGVP